MPAECSHDYLIFRAGQGTKMFHSSQAHIYGICCWLSFFKICLQKIRPVRSLDPWTCLVSLGRGSALGEKGKISASESSREIFWGGERGGAFARRYFAFLTPVFCLFPALRSLVPGYFLVIFSDRGTITAENHLLYENELWIKRKLLSV